MAYIAPPVKALANWKAEVWYAPATLPNGPYCQTPFFANNQGQGADACEEGVAEWAPGRLDRPVICVSHDGPVPGREDP